MDAKRRIEHRRGQNDRLAKVAALAWSALALHGCIAGVDGDGTAGHAADDLAAGVDAAWLGREAAAPGDAASAAAPVDELVDKALLQTCRAGAGTCEIFSWRSNQVDQVLRPLSTHLCTLSRVNGELNKNTSVLLHDSVNNLSSFWPNALPLETSGGTWKLAGRQESPAGNTTLRAEAICTPLSRFLINSGGVKWISTAASVSLFTGSSGCSKQANAAAWWGDASTYISGIRGSYEGSGEATWIEQGAPTTSSQLFVKTARCNSIAQSTAYSFFAGMPSSGRSPRIWCDGECASQGGEYRVSASNGTTDTVVMVPTTLATCYFTRISGEFNGPNEGVRIFPSPPDPFGNAEHWVLEAKAGSSSSASASVRCVQHNQIF